MDTESSCLVIPDIHHKIECVQKIRALHPDLPAVFLGDYFDDFEDTPSDMEKTCEWLAEAIGNEKDSFLVGNHCFAYLSYELGVTWGYCSGWTRAKQQIFHHYFPHDSLLRQAKWFVKKQGWLLTHAGINNPLFKSFAARKTEEDIEHWIEDAQNALLAGIAHPAFVAGHDRGGPYQHGGLLWCDWDSFRPIKGIRQILGHTPAKTVRRKHDSVCLDTHLRHYGILEQGALTVVHLDSHVPQSFFPLH